MPCPEVFALVHVPAHLLGALSLDARAKPTGPPPLDPGECALRVVVDAIPPALAAATSLPVGYAVMNEGPATLAGGGDTPVNMGARWIDARTGAVAEESRDHLAYPLGPGERASGVLELWTPVTPGAYVLRVSGVQEHVRWFDDVDAAWGCAAQVMVTPRED